MIKIIYKQRNIVRIWGISTDFHKKISAHVFKRFRILEGNAGVKYYIDVMLPVSREIATPDMRISVLKIKYIKTN